jgi:NAD(P)-dependent dehydrogenase (short-subunit alcohol dehydrogenase family)
VKNSSSRIAVITGASRGLGRAAALRLSQDGFLVVINYAQNEPAAKKSQQEIIDAGNRSLILQGDLSNLQGFDDFFLRLDRVLLEQTGNNKFDALICNAGIIRNMSPTQRVKARLTF